MLCFVLSYVCLSVVREVCCVIGLQECVKRSCGL